MASEDGFTGKGEMTLEKETCPYISEPSNECYFLKTDSRSIDSALAFCLQDYTKCGIFESLSSLRREPVN